MLTKIALAPEALGEHREVPSLMRSVHLAALEALNAHGRIVFRSSKEALKFINATRNSGLSPDLAKRWDALLGSLRANKRAGVLQPQDDLSISSLTGLQEIETAWAGRVSVMVLGSDVAEAIGVPADEGVLEDSSVELELSTLHSATLTKALRHLRELAASSIFPLRARDTFWEWVLEPVAEISRTAILMDRYIFSELWFRGRNKPYMLTKAEPEHVVWLLKRLDQSMCEGAAVHIVALEASPGPDLADTAALILKSWNPSANGRLSSVSITLAKTSKGFPHDRHLRFDTGIGVTLNAGFDRLSKPECWDANGMSWAYIYMPHDIEVLRQRESQALKIRGASKIILQR